MYFHNADESREFQLIALDESLYTYKKRMTLTLILQKHFYETFSNRGDKLMPYVILTGLAQTSVYIMASY